MMHVGGYHEYRGGCSVPWRDIIFRNLSNVGGYHDTCGGYHEHCVCLVSWGTQITKHFSSHGTQDNPPRYS